MAAADETPETGKRNEPRAAALYRAFREASMLRWAIIFLIISLVAGAFGTINVSNVARRISLVLFALFLIAFLIVVALVYLVGSSVAPVTLLAPALIEV
jgi:uncharacterized membrane protein YtjA (UPF0391 family)